MASSTETNGLRSSGEINPVVEQSAAATNRLRRHLQTTIRRRTSAILPRYTTTSRDKRIKAFLLFMAVCWLPALDLKYQHSAQFEEYNAPFNCYLISTLIFGVAQFAIAPTSVYSRVLSPFKPPLVILATISLASMLFSKTLPIIIWAILPVIALAWPLAAWMLGGEGKLILAVVRLGRKLKTIGKSVLENMGWANGGRGGNNESPV